jgi:RNA polymerase sigma-70 factor (ECF subfamily)
MDELRATVNDLARACAHSDDAGDWEELVRGCTPLVTLVVMRVARLWMNGSTPDLAADIVQDVFLKLCENQRRILREFEPRGDDSFLGLLRTISTSVANDCFRRYYAEKRGGKVVTSTLAENAAQGPATAETPETAGLNRTVLFSQLNEKLLSSPEAVSERDRGIFWLYYRQGFTAEEISSLPSVGLTAKGVESALRRISQWLRGEIRMRRSGDRPEGRGGMLRPGK